MAASVSISNPATDQLVGLSIDLSAPVSVLKALVIAEDDASLASCGVVANDILEVRYAGQFAPSRSGPQPTLENIPPPLFNGNRGCDPERKVTFFLALDPAALQNYIKSQPALLQQLLHMNPTMAEAVLSDNPSFLHSLLLDADRRRHEAKMQEQAAIAALNADPFDLAAQAKIAETIRQKNVEENMEMAMEHNPAAFGSVVMLYVPMTVNNIAVPAFIDSGAQSTIMSVECATRCNIMHLLDRRFAGVAKGVGTAKIIGRVHAALVRVGGAVISCSITILESPDMQFLFGLDNLRKHQALIDLKDNCLRIADQAIPFLAEKDLPASVRFESSGDSKAEAPRPAGPGPNSASDAGSGSQASARAPAPSVPAQAAAHRPAAGPSSMSGVTGPGAATARSPAVPMPSTSGSGVGSSSGSGSGSTPPQARVPTAASEEVLGQLTRLGFGREASLQALALCGGNVELAASYLFSSQAGIGF